MTSAPYTIRPAQPKDFDAIIRLNHQLFLFERQFNHTYNLDWPLEAAGQQYFQNRLSNPNSIILVAETHQKLTGYLAVHIDTYSYRSQNPIAEIENMYIDTVYRQQGMGRALLSQLKKLLKQKGVRRLKVEALIQNQPALNFYRNLGFIDSHLTLEQEL